MSQKHSYAGQLPRDSTFTCTTPRVYRNFLIKAPLAYALVNSNRTNGKLPSCLDICKNAHLHLRRPPCKPPP
jgi:hypothetical protein